jgi:hypothetical protein
MILSDEALLSEISTFEDRRYDAMIRADVTYLSTIFDDGLVYTHGSGTRQDGADYLRGLAAGEGVHREISHGHAWSPGSRGSPGPRLLSALDRGYRA